MSGIINEWNYLVQNLLFVFWLFTFIFVANLAVHHTKIQYMLNNPKNKSSSKSFSSDRMFCLK